MNWTDQYVEYLYRLNSSEFIERDVYVAKRCLMDYLAVIHAGKVLNGKKVVRMLENTPDANNGVKVIGYNSKKSIETAAFINGFNAHVAELDDGVNSGIVHPGTPLFSALLPVAEFQRVNAVDFFRGVIVGYEAIIRLANAIQPSHKRKGYHATGTVGSIGATVGVLAMLRASRSTIKNGFSAACIAAGGTLKALEDDSELKPFNIANAASSAVNAYLTAVAGFVGPEDVLSGEKGFLQLMTDGVNADELLPESGALAIHDIYIKPFAACRYCHPAIEAAIKLKRTVNFEVAEVEKVHIATYDLAVKNHDHIDVESISAAKMSIPFSVALSLTQGKAGLQEFSIGNLKNRDVLTLTQKTSVIADDRYSEAFPYKSLASVTLSLKNGKSYTELVDYPKGEPENPLSDVELKAKFAELMDYSGKTKDEISELSKVVMNLSGGLSPLFTLL